MRRFFGLQLGLTLFGFGLVVASCGESHHSRRDVSTILTYGTSLTFTISKPDVDSSLDGYWICKTQYPALIKTARRDPETLRRAIRTGISPGDKYEPAFDGCLGAIWKPSFGPTPSP